ncbi:MAG TPA: hypothetical protein DCR97_11840 [Deltaproteobacteria bacterium]|nr:hypothetical protein [Deltaproteobacteria bacterium]
MAHYTKDIPRPDFKGETNTDFKVDVQVQCVNAATCEVKDCPHAAVHVAEASCSEPCAKKIAEKCKVVV